eukprot:CCRYP_019997-RB/>CCRYP_019997-RB protein AED:0.07 eAED:0.07 QI:234/0.93/0.94/1/0.87/0.82/17/67/1724
MGKKRGQKKRSVSIDQATTTAIEAVTAANDDLSTQRHDEETVLSAIYGNDFSLETGAWNCPLYKIRIRPASEVTDHKSSNNHVNNTEPLKKELTLQIQLNKKYPYSVPMIQLTNIVGIPTTRIAELLNLLQAKANECAQSGVVMGWELGQVVQEFLVDYMLLLEQENKQRERDLIGKYKSQMDQLEHLDNYEVDESDRADHAGQSSSPSSPGREELDSDIQKEVARQMEALDIAEKLRRQRRQDREVGVLSTTLAEINENDAAEDDEGGRSDDDFFQFSDEYKKLDLELPPTSGSSIFSRYQTDFVELAALGRGGGGEVVKAINRLDRRVYAIKRIVLESEEFEDDVYSKGSKTQNQWAIVQNQKLRREVTTISRMTHKNIVRYYQAWVEGGQGESVKDKHGNIAPLPKGQEQLKNDNNASSDYSWSSSSASSASSSSTDSSSSNETPEFAIQKKSQNAIDYSYSRSLSLDNFLEHEMAQFSNPLLYNDHVEQGRYAETSASSRIDSDSDQLQRARKPSLNWAKKILYIQMEYCKTTMRDMIDESKLTIDMVWKFLRQILEALSYIHGQNVIHRDLKPANIFVDTEGEVKLGDFGLATTHKTVGNGNELSFPENEAESLHDAIHSISGILGYSLDHQGSTKSITGGVGTVFYVAPEQHSKLKHSDGSYDSKADIFSLGVLLFEMFNLHPFATYMERAEILTTLRGDPVKGVADKDATAPLFTKDGALVGDWSDAASRRFPEDFRKSVPENAQHLILWCLERNPLNRPSAKLLLTCGLLPRKVELEQSYLDEVLQTLSDPQSEQSYRSILAKLFERPNPKHVLTTFDTDLAVKTSNSHDLASHMLFKSLNAVKGSYWSSHSINVTSSPMSACSTAAAATALRRARNIGHISGGGKEGEALRGVPQQVATILAMKEVFSFNCCLVVFPARLATSAAVTGSFETILGSDPHMVDMLCSKMSSIFRSHGAVRLRPPCLRPRDQSMDFNSVNGPAEFLNDQGYVLLMREDLTVNFARAIARCGSAANNIKRYDIDTVYHESDAGGQPNESLEAAFDIIQDTYNTKPELMEAEAMLIICRVMGLLSPKYDTRIIEVPPIIFKSPIWFLRLSHSRLSDAIMDLLTVPKSDTMRHICLNIFTSTTAPNPIELLNERTQRHSGKHKKKSRELKESKLAYADKCFATAVENENIPETVAERFHAFISYGNSLPYPTDARKALDIIYNASKRLHHADINSGRNRDQKGSQRSFEEIVKSIHQIKSFIQTMESFGIVSAATQEKNVDVKSNDLLSNPAFIALDIGLRHRRLHYHGIIYQAILVRDNFFEEEKPYSRDFSSKGVRIAEGGRYDELVRHFRPPGNLSTPIPLCVGIRFSVGKLLERIYQNSIHPVNASTSKRHSHVEIIRRSLGYPFLECPVPIQCIITSENGMDRATASERGQVASLLWRYGISCDYVTQGGLIMSLLKLFSSDVNDGRSPCEWNAEMICGICAILKVPFVVVVVPHLLSSKNAVKLRATTMKTPTVQQYNYAGSEELVVLPSLPLVLLERLSSADDDDAGTGPPESNSTIAATALHSQSQSRQNHNIDVDCTFVGTDQYYDDEHKVKSDNPQWKNVKKVMKTSTQKMISHLNHLFDPGQSIPVIATDLPFSVVRDIGGCLMLHGLTSLHSSHVASKYPEHKKTFRTLMYALDNQCRKSRAFAKGVPDAESLSNLKNVSIFLYSIPCDKYDLITLSA